MNHRTLSGETSDFAMSLRTFLEEHHPQLSSDRNFIRRRAEAAEKVYRNASKDGDNTLSAMRQANAVLYDGLRFSRYDTLFDIVSE